MCWGDEPWHFVASWDMHQFVLQEKPLSKVSPTTTITTRQARHLDPPALCHQVSTIDVAPTVATPPSFSTPWQQDRHHYLLRWFSSSQNISFRAMVVLPCRPPASPFSLIDVHPTKDPPKNKQPPQLHLFCPPDLCPLAQTPPLLRWSFA